MPLFLMPVAHGITVHAPLMFMYPFDQLSAGDLPHESRPAFAIFAGENKFKFILLIVPLIGEMPGLYRLGKINPVPADHSAAASADTDKPCFITVNPCISEAAEDLSFQQFRKIYLFLCLQHPQYTQAHRQAWQADYCGE